MFYSNATVPEYTGYETTGQEHQAETGMTQVKPVTAEEIAEIVVRAIGSLRIYVLESDITEAQNNVKAVAEQASF